MDLRSVALPAPCPEPSDTALAVDRKLYCLDDTLVTATDDSGPRVRKRLLRSTPAFDASLTYYPPGLSQAEHDHDRSQYSLILAGGLVERVEGIEHQAGPGEVSAKPRGVVHADRYGPCGALLLAFTMRDESTADEVNGGDSWHWRMARADGRAAVLDLVNPAWASDSDDLFWDMFSVAERRTSRAFVPDWLKWARSTLDSQAGRSVGIGTLAAEAGVHRVHLSREFVRHFGLSPSAYRQRQMAARALRAMVDDHLAPALAAQDAGFVDQSHMARAIRSTFGTTPRRIAALLAA
jgi:AraC-like DNA-binding protein/quercetin dioxygenase-like cupin family protein